VLHQVTGYIEFVDKAFYFRRVSRHYDSSRLTLQLRK
jgi:hypothetical protein